MALSDLQRLRLRIQDRVKVSLEESIGLGDGSRTRYLIQMSPVAAESEEIKVAGTPLVREVGYEIDNGTGLVTLTAAPDAGDEIIASYEWSVFSDVELEDFLLLYTDVTRAAIAALKSVLADHDRFIKYQFGQESVDRSGARDAIKDLIDRLEDDIRGRARLIKANTPERQNLITPYFKSPYNDASDTE